MIERVLAWSGTDRFEYCQVWEQLGTLSARGTILTGDFRADYEVDTGPGYEAKRLRVQVTAAGVVRTLRLHRDLDGVWSARGADPRYFADATEIDLDLSPLLVGLPLLRRPLHRQLGRRHVVVAAVTLPELTVQRREQTLTHLRPGVVRAAIGPFTADLRVDADGYVSDYPGVGTRVRPSTETEEAVC